MTASVCVCVCAWKSYSNVRLIDKFVYSFGKRRWYCFFHIFFKAATTNFNVLIGIFCDKPTQMSLIETEKREKSFLQFLILPDLWSMPSSFAEGRYPDIVIQPLPCFTKWAVCSGFVCSVSCFAHIVFSKKGKSWTLIPFDRVVAMVTHGLCQTL